MSKKRNKTCRRRSLQGITLCISTALVLILLGMVVFSVLTAQNLSTYVRENLTVTMMLSEDMTNPEAMRLSKQIKRKPYVNNIKFISKEQVLKEQTAAMGTDPSEFIGANPFVSSLELQLNAQYANNDSLAWITKELRKNTQITDISYPKDLMDSVNENLNKINIVLLILALLLTCVSFTLINNTVKLGVYASRFNIHTMKLVGASWGFIRKPFVKKAVVKGLIAAIIANIALGAGIYALYNYEPQVLTVITWQVLAITGGAVFLFGILITMLCAWLSVNRFLKMTAGELYKI